MAFSYKNLGNSKKITRLKVVLIVILALTILGYLYFDSQPELPNQPASNDGIKMIYPTKQGGRTWYSNWENESAKKIESGDRNPSDKELIVRGDGYLNIDNNGIAHLKGDSPRIYIYDELKKKTWGDVEVTVYSKRISESRYLSSQGIVIGARSNHQDVTTETPCLGATYYGRLLYDGRAVLQKELIHEVSYSSNKPSESNKVRWNTNDGTMPTNTWVGMKFIVKNDSDNKSVRLELYRDLSDGKDGGSWEKIAEYIDNGNWSQNSDIDIQKICGYPENKVLVDPGVSVFIRNDSVNDVEYKLFSIREI